MDSMAHSFYSKTWKVKKIIEYVLHCSQFSILHGDFVRTQLLRNFFLIEA